MKFIESKLRPPDLSPSLLKREHLVERLRSNLELSATFICAGPGWGKTTLAVEFFHTTNRALAWYDIDSSDADIVVFFQYLLRAIQQTVPGFGLGTLDMLRSGASTRPDQLADLFLYELSEEVEQETLLVLDNIHHTFAADWSAPLLYRILQLLPENIHLMLLARVAPSFTFSRMRSKQTMDQIDDHALAFTRAEAKQLLADVLDDNDTIDLLLDWTQGWVAGLQIIRQALEADEKLREQRIEKILTHSQAEIFDYFAEKVYRANPPEVRALLVRSALPQRITPEVLNDTLGLSLPSERLHRIVRENIFLSRVAGETDSFIYHPLFRDFLCKQLEGETTPEQRADMHGRLARYYEGKENWALALHHYFEARDEAGAAEMLLHGQRQLLTNGLAGTVSKYFARFRKKTLDHQPQLYNLMGEMHIIEGDTASSDSMFQFALEASRAVGDQSAEAAALAGLAQTAARNHNFKDAIRYAEESERRIGEVKVFPQSVTLAARIKNVVGAVRSFEGRYIEANDLMEDALRLAHEAGDARLVRTISHNLALPAYMEGDFRRALRYYARSPISDAKGDSGRQLHPDSITLYLNRAAIYTAQGELALAEQDLDSAAEVTTVFSLRGFIPRILEGRANIARERKQFDEASRLYNDALNEYRRVDADPVKTDLYYERALLEMRKCEFDQALDLINLMIDDRKESRREIDESLARQMRGRILVARDDARAIADVDTSEPLLRRLRCNYYLAISCYLKARTLAARDLDGGRRALAEFLSLAEQFDYKYFIACEESFHPALLDLCSLYSISSEWLNEVMVSYGV